MSVTLFSLRFGRARGKMPPLGAMSLAASLAAEEISCDLVDTQFDPAINPFAVEALVASIRQSRSPILAFSIFNDAVPLLTAVLDLLQPELAGRRVFLGGPGVVGIERRLIERLPAVEMVIVGEGETALPLAITDPGAARQRQGVFCRDDHGHPQGSGRSPRENLDAIPAVQWDWCKGRGYSTL
ncbi:MAG TPA: cobalamin-dependent protein, partial [Thermoanaerobaculia bacterium]|nr:cobalamin-dependent protein [Thermoanaerobaculia bacterium]